MTPDELTRQHLPDAVRRRLQNPSQAGLVQDAVLGAVDGCVTTFAIVAAGVASNLPDTVVLILGMANLLADGLSMAVSNYNAVQTRQHELDSARRTEHSHIDNIPEGEREEIRQIFAAKGFDGEALEHIVSVISSNRTVWVNTMLTEELGLQPVQCSPVRASVVTCIAFLVAGFIPLSPFLMTSLPLPWRFVLSAMLGASTFFLIGLLRGRVFHQRPFPVAVVTLLTGGGAAAVAYAVGILGMRMTGSP